MSMKLTKQLSTLFNLYLWKYSKYHSSVYFFSIDVTKLTTLFSMELTRELGLCSLYIC